MAAAQGVKLPEDFIDAAKGEGLRKSVLEIFLKLQVPPPTCACPSWAVTIWVVAVPLQNDLGLQIATLGPVCYPPSPRISPPPRKAAGTQSWR